MKVNYADSLRTLRQAVGDKKLFTQVTSEDYEGILQEAEYICSITGKDTYIKVPANEVGVKAIRTLHERGYKTLGTLCFTTIQAMMALQAGADYVAVLYNYMVNVGYDASKTLKDIAAYVRESGCRGKLMGVGVRSQEQFSDCAGWEGLKMLIKYIIKVFLYLILAVMTFRWLLKIPMMLGNILLYFLSIIFM